MVATDRLASGPLTGAAVASRRMSQGHRVCADVQCETEDRALVSRLEWVAAAPLPWTVDPDETCSAADSSQTVGSQEVLVRRGPG